jgi:hypothetical protein
VSAFRPSSSMTIAGLVVFLAWLVALVDGILAALALLRYLDWL